MHSPPPTPGKHGNSLLPATSVEPNQSAPEEMHTAQQAAAIALANGARHARKRSATERAGLMTPRETPMKRTPRTFAHTDNYTGKILFPMRESGDEVFKVYEDAREPDLFSEDKANPFMQQPAASCNMPEPTTSHAMQRTQSSESESCRTAEKNPFATPRGTQPPVDPTHIPPHPLEVDGDAPADRTDGLYYIARGKRIFKPFADEADMLDYHQSGPPPKLLFQAEIREQQRTAQARTQAHDKIDEAMQI
ncbi:hypothetical protein BCR37DRAFT_17144 [Protomyces lactucae-debilis]|uniref:Uncharacterized protein n=1 Tax=Protomyces lactucae-debilis TaxID=2754530 RepID=A0A1Y2FWN4_PROLT|nr:uncharacterized protein BCR37DRAFT_17144 [Protomyces lactucae-debilis]ORY87947.1 hypothetical protein BCR37DRAFT_17144 [Protomyces lactucae-debilis]